MAVMCPWHKAGQQPSGLHLADQGNDPAPLLSTGETQLDPGLPAQERHGQKEKSPVNDH